MIEPLKKLTLPAGAVLIPREIVVVVNNTNAKINEVIAALNALEQHRHSVTTPTELAPQGHRATTTPPLEAKS